jgi:hypothetical protein
MAANVSEEIAHFKNRVITTTDRVITTTSFQLAFLNLAKTIL